MRVAVQALKWPWNRTLKLCAQLLLLLYLTYFFANLKTKSFLLKRFDYLYKFICTEFILVYRRNKELQPLWSGMRIHRFHFENLLTCIKNIRVTTTRQFIDYLSFQSCTCDSADICECGRGCQKGFCIMNCIGSGTGPGSCRGTDCRLWNQTALNGVFGPARKSVEYFFDTHIGVLEKSHSLFFIKIVLGSVFSRLFNKDKQLHLKLFKIINKIRFDIKICFWESRELGSWNVFLSVHIRF